ncbi:MAG: hypothetical protein AB1591_12215 [Pseudomonadota bacterium]
MVFDDAFSAPEDVEASVAGLNGFPSTGLARQRDGECTSRMPRPGPIHSAWGEAA